MSGDCVRLRSVSTVHLATPSGGKTPTLSRRHWLLGAVATSVWGCPAGDVTGSAAREPAAATPASASAPLVATPPVTAPSATTPPAPAKPGGLDVIRLGPLREDEKGGTLVVLLHGWRAHGDDLVSLARRLAQPRTRFLVPAGPLLEPGGGRAWWRLDGNARPAHAWKDEVLPDHHPNPQVTAARQAVQSLLRDAEQRYAPDSIAIAGFSQGAMLALDVAIAAEPAVARVAALSGVVLADSLPALHRGQASPPAVFVSHGRQDPVLPFAGGASIETVLGPHGYRVTFAPFDGRHEIPAAVVAQLGRFLFG
jgi:phospholipase/carboxylesterase